jgi:hypothetical protein
MVIPKGTYQTTDSGGGTVSLMISGGQAIVGAAGSAGTPCVDPAPVNGPVFVTICENDLGYAGQTLIVSGTLAGPTTLEGQTQLCTETYATRAASCREWNWSIELPPVPGYYTGKAAATGAPVAVFVSGSTVTVDAPGVPDICDPAPGTFSGPSSRFNLTCKGTFNGSPGMLWVGGYESQVVATLQGQSYVCATGVRCKTAIWTANWAGSPAPSAAGARIAGTPAVAGSLLSVPLGCSRGACRVTVVARDAAGRLGARHETLLRRGEKRL